ncbi:MAG TPA: hypothetical protein VIT65_21650, partial [Microlunatus sp.]
MPDGHGSSEDLGDFVGVDSSRGRRVQHGPDRDRRVGLGQPLPELIQRDRSVFGADHPVLVDQGLVADMNMNHDPRPAPRRLGPGVWPQIEPGTRCRVSERGRDDRISGVRKGGWWRGHRWRGHRWRGRWWRGHRRIGGSGRGDIIVMIIWFTLITADHLVVTLPPVPGEVGVVDR